MNLNCSLVMCFGIIYLSNTLNINNSIQLDVKNTQAHSERPYHNCLYRYLTCGITSPMLTLFSCLFLKLVSLLLPTQVKPFESVEKICSESSLCVKNEESDNRFGVEVSKPFVLQFDKLFNEKTVY